MTYKVMTADEGAAMLADESRGREPSPLGNVIRGLEIGQCIKVDGIPRGKLASFIFATKKRTGKHYSVRKAADGGYIVFRVEPKNKED